MKILMVCLGNICRSPLAEGILKAKIGSKGLDWEVDSAGTSAWHIGDPPDPRSIEIARTNGIDISSQKARQFKYQDFETFDLILVMDSSNYNNIKSMAKTDSQVAKVKLILNFSQPGSNRKVPDPYYDDNFEAVYHLLDMACEALLN